MITVLGYDAAMWMVRCGLLILTVAGVACSGAGSKPDGGGGAGGGSGGTGNRWTGAVSAINRNVDILFMIDDSSSMDLQQANLIANFPTFMTRLQDPPGLPNVHIAVVSQDMGAGDGSIAGCDATGGKNGIFQYTARGACTATNLQGGATYIVDVAGVRNYTGNLQDVFGCIAALGNQGCGFEHQFASILRALGADGQAAPLENQGFLRPDAFLTIVMLTNEDDCSAKPTAPLFDTTKNTNIGSEVGPPANFRCNEFGHVCKNAAGMLGRPSRKAPNNDVMSTVSYTDCASDESGEYLLTVADTASKLKALKADPGQIAVVSIQGPSAPYTVTWKAPSTADSSCGASSCPWPVIGHSCTASDGTFADPGVRTAQLAGAFGDNGLVLSICDTNYGPALDRTAELINRLVGPTCLTGGVPLDLKTGDPDCKVTEHYTNDVGAVVDKAVPFCGASVGVPPCWHLDSAATCLGGAVLNVSSDPELPLSANATITYDCAKCTSGGC
jgi:hypothetical protein